MLQQIVLAALLAVRPVSDAERTAVQIAADYLSRGPEAVAAKLAPGAPMAQLPRATQLAEIEARLGPRDGAQWELQTVAPEHPNLAAFTVTFPSGWDDHVIFEMTQHGGAWMVRDVRFLAQAVPNAAPVAEAKAAEAAPKRASTFALPLSLAAAAAILFVSALVLRRRQWMATALAAAALVPIGFAALLLSRGRTPAVQQASAVAARTGTDLTTLLPLRRALALGDGNVAAAYAAVDRTSQRGAIADLWKAHADLLDTNVTAARDSLSRFASPTDRPLAAILAARLALLQNDEVSAVLAYEQAVSLGPGRDGLWYEAAEALSAMGFEDRAKGYLERLEKIGSRDADVYYALAGVAAARFREEDDARAEEYLRRAWNMRPVEREQLIETGLFWSVLRRPGIVGLIRLSSAAEPLVRAAELSRRPIALPAEAAARTSGDYLHVAIGNQQLVVPGGAALAPVGTPVVEPSAWERSEEERRLADLESLLSVGTGASAFAQPVLRQRITATADALAARNRWSDLVRLTENLSPASDSVPPSLFFLRSVGLQRLDRSEEAKRLLADVATSRVLQRKRDAGAYIALAELFAAHDLHDAAVRMYDRSLQIRQNPFVDDRVRQIQMNKRLATRYSTHNTTHFEIHYPDDVTPMLARQLGEVLEREQKRLRRWIPLEELEPVVVNVTWWHEFRGTYTGSDFVLGFYNGKITVPFAGVDATNPNVVAILSHELAHAMIAQATGDHAPRWFQEGLAQRIELRQFHENAFNMYEDDHLLPVALLDAVLRGSPDPEMITAAYTTAQTHIRFVESRFGRKALTAMLTAYREGATTEEAIGRACGKSPPDYEAEFRQWGRSERRVFENTPADLGL